MNLITETERLYLREFNAEDAIHLYEMNNDHEVIQYTGDKPFNSISEASEFLKNYKEYELNKMGRWAVCSKKNHAFLGWCGLKYHPDKKIVEVGFRFYKQNWNKGFATESTMASIDYGFKTLKLAKIYAHAHQQNFNSQKVLEKCGMDFIKKFNYDGMPANLYKIENQLITIKKINSQDTYAVRHPILRKGRPIEDCRFDHDDDDSTFHLGLFIQNELLGVVTLIKNDFESFEGNQFQLRGMAVRENYQKRGFGNLLIKKGEELVRQENGTLIWCNVREIAKDFYKRNGYKKIGRPFDIPKIGVHYVMYKIL